MRRNRRKNMYLFLFILVCSLGIGYAFLRTELSINGTADFLDARWDVHFANLVVNPDSVELSSGNTAATISASTIEVTYAVTLKEPGDFYEFTVDAVNSGTMDAMIDTISSKMGGVEITTLPTYMEYSVTYSDGVALAPNQYLKAGETETYKVHIGFKKDISASDLTGQVENKTFSFSVTYVQADDSAIKVKHPLPIVLDEGMIPVTIANDGTVTAVSYEDDNWYDYPNKKWANAVLTTSTNRSTYQAIANGIENSATIPNNEILAYYVWIPRYSYKIWTLDASKKHNGEEQTIDIKFVDINTKESGTTVGSYYTHPAFTFGDEELSGFWVGKFEPSIDSSSVCYYSLSADDCNNANQSPRILPNVDSLRLQSVSNQFATSLKFAGGTQSGSTVTFAGNNTYGLTSSSDSHMMKNREWGAVAYLSHSVYGINKKIRVNNYVKEPAPQRTLTGCGASTDNESSSTTCGIPYGSASAYPQSTTGNISGVFDMSGGSAENVMANYNGTAGSSGFSIFPESKYYDNYSASVFTGTYSTNMTFCTLAICGGHALYETRAWYGGDNSSFVDSNYYWLLRGGELGSSQRASAFYSWFNSNGNSGFYVTWRSVLVTR